MTAKVLAPIQQIFGSAYSGYQLFSYLAGTSTKATTYKTSSGLTSHTNPIILDSIGGPAGETGIWIDPNKSYKFLLTTSTDTDPPSSSTFVYDNIAAGIPNSAGSTVTTTYTEALSDNKTTVYLDATAGNFTVTLLASATAGNGFEVTYKKIDSTTNTITLDGNGAETIDGVATLVLGKQYDAVTIGCNSVNRIVKDRNITLRNAAGTVILSADSTGLKLENDSAITDSSGNEYFKFSKTASAVNEFTVANAATGSGPTLSATGGDTNVDINLQAKGTGVFNLKATADSAAEIRLFEDTDNGTNYIGLKAASSISANKTFIWPSADGSANQSLQTDGSGTLSFGIPAGALINVQAFTASGTYTKTAGTTKALVYVTAGGGGGGSGNAGNSGSGGGAGGTAIKWITSSLGSTETVTVGAAGTAGTGGGNGGAGGTSSFGTHCSATGGNGGNLNGGGGSGGTASNGTVNIGGGGGQATDSNVQSGMGASSFWGGGGEGKSQTNPGAAGVAYGSGGSGASNSGSNNGGAGAGGIVLVFEYA